MSIFSKDNTVTHMKTVRYRLILKTINKYCTNKYIEFVISKPTKTTVWEKGIDKYANAITNNVYTTHKQQWSRNRVLEEARTLTFLFKNVHQAICVGKKYKKSRQSRRWVVIQSILCEDVLCVKRTVVVWRSPLYRSNEQMLMLTKAEKNNEQTIIVVVIVV